MFGEKKTTPTAPAAHTLSATAAQAVYRELMLLDGQLQTQVSYVHSAAQQIAVATGLVNELYDKRSVLAQELARVAPEGFGGSIDGAGVAAPAMGANRFYKPHPLPHGALAPLPAAGAPTPPWQFDGGS